ncbi:MAG: cohesin domain-containing protein [Anaerolineae bacterium]
MTRALRVIAVALLFLSSAVPQVARAQAPLLGLSAPTLVLPLGGEVAVDVTIAGVSDLYGAQVTVVFDQGHLQVRDADGDPGNGVQVSAGELLQTGYQATNSADNGAGTIIFAAGLQQPSPPISGSGSLVRIVFSAVAAGSATVSITDGLLSDSDGYAIAYSTGTPLTITIGEAGWVVGRVTLQGRTNHAGTPVYAGSYSGVTDSTGAFRIAAPAGVYQVSTEAPRYLDALKTGVRVQVGQETALAAVKLLGGDANDDGVINITDLAIIGRAFGSVPGSGHWDERADINGDSAVNICDFVLAASNFGRSEPLAWL